MRTKVRWLTRVRKWHKSEAVLGQVFESDPSFADTPGQEADQSYCANCQVVPLCCLAQPFSPHLCNISCPSTMKAYTNKSLKRYLTRQRTYPKYQLFPDFENQHDSSESKIKQGWRRHEVMRNENNFPCTFLFVKCKAWTTVNKIDSDWNTIRTRFANKSPEESIISCPQR